MLYSVKAPILISMVMRCIMAYSPKWMNDETARFVKALLLLETEEEAARFLDDVCTVKEIQALSQRLHVAELLSEKRTYVDIEERTKASTATISRVNRALSYGADGYQLIFDRLSEDR